MYIYNLFNLYQYSKITTLIQSVFLDKKQKTLIWHDCMCVCLPGLSFAQYSHQHKFLCVNMATFWIWDLLQFCEEILSHKQLCIQMKELLSGSFEICDDLHVHEKVKAIYAEIIMSLQMTYPLWHIKMQTNSTIECIFGNAWHISVLNIFLLFQQSKILI